MNSISKNPTMPKYPWDGETSQCLKCKKYNFLERFGTGPLTCKAYPHGMRHEKIINKEICDFFDENDESYTMQSDWLEFYEGSDK